jgi:crotonobetainyl-CoA:carnitine CoA-transferase CaiB-like acyl-CoA transferase
MLEALVGADSITFASVLNGGAEHGSPRPGLLVFEIGGRYVAFQITGSAQLWPRLLALMGRPELADDPRFKTSALRRKKLQLREIIGEWVAHFTTVEEALALSGHSCAPVLSPQS